MQVLDLRNVSVSEAGGRAPGQASGEGSGEPAMGEKEKAKFCEEHFGNAWVRALDATAAEVCEGSHLPGDGVATIVRCRSVNCKFW